MRRLLLVPAAFLVALLVACGGDKTPDIKVNGCTLEKWNASVAAYDDTVDEWHAHVEAEDAVSQRCSVWIDDAGFEAWAKDMGYALGKCN